jgi:hypothetical protein
VEAVHSPRRPQVSLLTPSQSCHTPFRRHAPACWISPSEFRVATCPQDCLKMRGILSGFFRYYHHAAFHQTQWDRPPEIDMTPGQARASAIQRPQPHGFLPSAPVIPWQMQPGVVASEPRATYSLSGLLQVCARALSRWLLPVRWMVSVRALQGTHVLVSVRALQGMHVRHELWRFASTARLLCKSPTNTADMEAHGAQARSTASSRASCAESRQGKTQLVPARQASNPVQGLWRCRHLRARPGAELLQGA